jgi:UDP-2-acetamido-3-amino-2,3-dideoxy-glucuronate N-acetyltransferase
LIVSRLLLIAQPTTKTTMNTQYPTNNEQQPTTNNQQPTISDQRPFVHESAYVDDGAEIGAGSKIWHFSHIMKGAKIGERCSFGQNVNVDGGVTIGNNVKVQNNVSIYTGTVIEDDVFLGPSCVLTNVTNPRSQVNRHSLYEKTLIRRGATIGANATIVCGVTLGRYCFIAAGSVVTKDVPDYALMMGNPARQKGWMSRHGHILKNPDKDGILVCPESGLRYQLTTNNQQPTTNDQRSPTNNQRSPTNDQRSTTNELHCLDLAEDSPLPSELSRGTTSYRQFKSATCSLPCTT